MESDKEKNAIKMRETEINAIGKLRIISLI